MQWQETVGSVLVVMNSETVQLVSVSHELGEPETDDGQETGIDQRGMTVVE